MDKSPKRRRRTLQQTGIPKPVGGVLWRTSPGEIDVKSSGDTVITQNNWSLWISHQLWSEYLGIYCLRKYRACLLEMHPVGSQETVNGQKHMDAASAASKAREARLEVQKPAKVVTDMQPIFELLGEDLWISWTDNKRPIPHCDQDSSWAFVPWMQMWPLRHDDFSWAKQFCRSSMTASSCRS